MRSPGHADAMLAGLELGRPGGGGRQWASDSTPRSGDLDLLRRPWIPRSGSSGRCPVNRLPLRTRQVTLVPVIEEPIVAGSALKHGLKKQDTLHAYRNPIRIWDLGDGFTMTVGATVTGSFVEVGSVQGETAVVIVHAMRAREKFLR